DRRTHFEAFEVVYRDLGYPAHRYRYAGTRMGFSVYRRPYNFVAGSWSNARCLPVRSVDAARRANGSDGRNVSLAPDDAGYQALSMDRLDLVCADGHCGLFRSWLQYQRVGGSVEGPPRSPSLAVQRG